MLRTEYIEAGDVVQVMVTNEHTEYLVEVLREGEVVTSGTYEEADAVIKTFEHAGVVLGRHHYGQITNGAKAQVYIEYPVLYTRA